MGIGLAKSDTGIIKQLVGRVGKRTSPVRVTGLRGASRALIAAELIRPQGKRAVLVLTPHSRAARRRSSASASAARECGVRTRTARLP